MLLESKDFDFLEQIISREKNWGGVNNPYLWIVADCLSPVHKEQLHQLVNGPVWDGEVISKGHRGDLIKLGLAVRTCVNGEQGFTGATYLGYEVDCAVGSMP